MREKAEQGMWPSFAPLGYRNVVGPDSRKIIEPDPGTASAVTGRAGSEPVSVATKTRRSRTSHIPRRRITLTLPEDSIGSALF